MDVIIMYRFKDTDRLCHNQRNVNDKLPILSIIIIIISLLVPSIINKCQSTENQVNIIKNE